MAMIARRLAQGKATVLPDVRLRAVLDLLDCCDWCGDADMSWGRAILSLIMIAALSLVITIVTSAAAPTFAAERFALVIGNQTYNANVGPLANPHNDITVVGKALTDVGFTLLPPRRDATRDEVLFAVYELASEVRTAGREAVSFLYYAGHGVAVGGENVLIPTNAENTTDAMLSVRGVRLGEILDILKREAPDAVHFVVLDACRNIRGRRGDRGFVPVNDRRTGVVIAFSTAPGETATDEGAAAAPYALALAEEIVKPGRTDQVVFNAVRTRVVNAARGQTPWIHDGLIGDRVVFKPTAGLVVTAPLAQPAPQAPASPVAELIAKCISEPRHPLAGEISTRLAQLYSPRKFTYGWKRDAEGNSAARDIVNPITSAGVVGSELHLSYEYQHGRLIVVPTIGQYTRKSDRPVVSLQGIWIQNNGYGCLKLLIDDRTGEAAGGWGVSERSPVEFPSAIRLANAASTAPSKEPSPVGPAPLTPWSFGHIAPPPDIESAYTRVTSFTYFKPPPEVDPGFRIWRREADDTWSTTYPSGRVDRGWRIRRRIWFSSWGAVAGVTLPLKGCYGSVISKDKEPEFVVFIPDRNCFRMTAYWRRGEGDWDVLGPMHNVQPE